MDKANKVSPKTNSLEATERSFTKTPTTKRPSGLNNSVRASSVLLQFDNEIIRVAQGIERYLLKHPGAADSLESVVKRWIACQCFEESCDHVQQALDFLIARGRIRKTMNTDGTYIYSVKRNRQNGYSK